MNIAQAQFVPIVAVPTATQTQGQSAPGTLLPAPETEGSLDAMAELYAVMADNRRASRANSFSDVATRREKIRFARQKLREALKKAEEEKDQGGMFGSLGKKLGTVGKIAAIAGAVALVVGTGGAGLAGVLAISAVCLSGAAFAQSETRFLQKLGMDDNAAMYTELGLVGASALCSGGAGLAALGASSASTAATAAETATELEKGAHLVGAAASITSGASGSASAYASWRAGECAANAEDHMTDAAAEQATEERLERLLMQLIDQIADTEKSDERTLGQLRGAIEAKGTALLIASRRA
jgi:hypothetical protein